MTEEELWLHNAALLDVQFCGNEKEVGILYTYSGLSCGFGRLRLAVVAYSENMD